MSIEYVASAGFLPLAQLSAALGAISARYTLVAASEATGEFTLRSIQPSASTWSEDLRIICHGGELRVMFHCASAGEREWTLLQLKQALALAGHDVAFVED